MEARVKSSVAPGWSPAARAPSLLTPAGLELILGCMFSGKTTELLRRIRAAEPGAVGVYKHSIDDRYRRDAVVAHTFDAVPAQPVDGAETLRQRILTNRERLIAVDEAHFFDDALVDVCGRLSHQGYALVLTALDRDSWGRPFPLIERLRTISTRVTVVHAICARCGALADRTQRTTPIIDDYMVGGPESYEPRCAACWRPPPANAGD